jgi:plasmid replication initiation protein
METFTFMSADDDKGGVLVTKDNRLIEARYKLTVNEQRLVLGLASMVRKDDEDFKDYVVHVDDIAELFGIDGGESLYERMEEATKALMTTSGAFNISLEPNKLKLVRWVSYAEYVKGSGKILMRFDKSIKDFMIQIKSQFTQYQLSAVRQFKSAYAIRFYELMAMKRNMGKGAKDGFFYREFEIDELKSYLAITKGEYKLLADLKRRAIEPALKEINEFSDIEIIKHKNEWAEYVKQGRAVHKIIIRAKPKKQRQMDLVEQTEIQAKDENTSKAQENLVKAGVSIETAKKWVNKFGSKRVERNLAYVLAEKKAGKVKTSLIGYISVAIEGDIANGWTDEQEKAIEIKRKAEAEERKKEREADEKSKRDREEMNRIFEIFQSQSESMQDVILDVVESKVEATVQVPAFINEIKKYRKNGEIKIFQAKTKNKFKEAMQENGLI